MSDNPFALQNIKPAAQQPVEENPFSLSAIQSDQRMQTRAVLTDAVKVAPEQAAQAAKLEKSMGIPGDVVLRNLMDVQMQQAVIDADAKLGTNVPVLTKAMRESAMLARQAHKDIDNLSSIEQLIRDTGGSVKAGVYNASRGAAGVFRAGFELVAPVLDPLESVTAIGGNPLRRLAEGFSMQAEAAGAIADAAAPKTSGVISGGFQSGIQSLTQNVLALPMAFFPGGQPAALSMMTSTTGGLAYQQAREKGLEMSQALPFAASQAAIEYATEKLPLDALIGGIKAGTPLMQTLVKQMALEIPGEQVATILQDLNEWAVLNPGKPFSEYLEERPNAAAQTLIATIVGTGGNVAIVKGIDAAARKLAGNAYESGVADAEAKRLNDALQAAQQSQLRDLNPDQFRSLVQQMADQTEGAPKEIYVDGDVLNQLAPEALAQLPQAVRDQIPQAAAIGDVVAIPMGDVLTVAPGTVLEQALVDNARIGDPRAMTRKEAQEAGAQAQEFLAQEAQRVMQQAQDQAAVEAEFAAVRDDLKTQIAATQRYSESVSDAYATGLTHFFVAYGSRTGMGTQGLYQAYRDRGFRISAQPTAQAQGQVLNDGALGQGGVFDLSVPEDGNQLRDVKFGDTTISLNARGRFSNPEGVVEVASVRTPQAKRGSGSARAALQALVQQADAQGVTLKLDASPLDRKTKGDKLVKFYESLGFQRTGRSNNAAGDPEMIREPQQAGGAFEQQANNLKSEIEQAGGVVEDVLQVDQLIDSKDIPTITLQDLVGKAIFPTIADRTAAAALYTGIDSSTTVAIPLLGGPFFPLRESNVQAGVVWANRGDGVIAQKAAKLKEGANYMLVVMGDANMHQSNSTVAAAFLATLDSYIANGRISKKNVKALDAMVRDSGEKAIAELQAKLADADSAVAKAANENDLKKAKKVRSQVMKNMAVANHVKNFPGFENTAKTHAYMDSVSFDARKRVLEIMASKQALNLGAPSMQKILDATREPSLAGHRWGDGVLLVEVDQTNPQVELGTEGTTPHPDFPVGVRGKVIGKLNAPINWQMLWQDWLAENSDKDSPRRAFELAKPIVTVTQDLVDRIGPITQANIDSARQARLAADFAAGNWRTSDNPVNKGGVSPQEFLDALRMSDGAATLSDYTLDELKAGIKNGTRKIYQLGDGQIYFMLEVRPDGSKYLASVVNNEQGARGIGGPAVVLKALEEGATDLDAFAVPSGKYPEGFLPALYGAFGFEVTERYKFDPKFFKPELPKKQRDRTLADAVEYWTTSTPGFDPKAGMPDAVVMKWSGTNEDRANITERYLRSGLEGLLAGRVDADVQAAEDELAAPDRQEAGQAAGPDVGGTAGDRGAGRGSSLASRARGTVQGIADLTDNELVNLGLTAADRAAVQRALGRPAAAGGNVLEQGPLGTFNPRSLELVLNPDANLSTLWHEMGHFFLEVMADISSQPNAPAQISADFDTFLKWAGTDRAQWAAWQAEYKQTGKINPDLVAIHERWAESIEQYIMEGKVPNAEMQPLMRRFSAWLLDVYKSIKKFLTDRGQTGTSPMALNDDIRRVMDRMLATDEQIQQANEAAGMAPNVEADAEANERLNKRSMADLKWTVKARDKAIKKLQAEAASIRKEIEEQVTLEVNQMPEVLAKEKLDALTVTPEHKVLLDQYKADRQAAIDAARTEITDLMVAEQEAKEGTLKGLAKGQFLAKSKREIANRVDARMIEWDRANPRPMRPVNITDMDMAVIADSYGFADVPTMLQAIDAFGNKRDVIEGMTEQRMLEEHGDLIDPRAIEQAANEAVHNEARARSLASELRTQQEMLNPRTDTGQVNAAGSKITVNALVEAAKQFGANVVARTPLKDLRSLSAKHTAAERRAAKRWQEATAKGDTQAAVKAKQDQMLNNAAAKAAIDALEEAKKITEFFKRVVKGNNEKVVEKGRDPDIVNAARAVLAAYGVQTPTTKAAADYLETLQRNDPQTYAAIEPMIAGMMQNAQPLQALTFQELQALGEEVNAMWHLAKRSRQMEVDGDLLDVEDVADEVYARMEEIGIPDTVPGETGALTKAEERSRMLQFAGALLRRVEQWAEAKDGKFGGPFLRYIFQPVKDAADRYRADRVVYRKKFQALVDNIAPLMRPGLVEAPELGYTFGRGHNGIGMAEMLHAILHTGNGSNKRKLLLGRGWATENADGTLDTSRWDAFIKRLTDTGVLTKAHYDFAQGVWDLMEETKPLAQKTHRDVFGRYFEEITAESFDTPFGTYRGGYVPAQADPLLVQDAELRDLLEGENESMSYSFPSTNRGFTKGRVEYNRPLKLDLRSLPQHLDKVLLFSHMEPAVRGVAKLIKQPKVSQPLGRIDPSAISGLLRPWLNRSARQIVETPILGDGRISRMASIVRARAGMTLMFANLSNTIQQITGLSTAAVKVKPAHLMRAVANYIANPRKASRAVWDASPYMDDRASNEVSAMNDVIDQILLDPSMLERGQAWTQRHGYFLQTAFDNILSPIVWTGAYNQAIEEGMEERMAIRFADGVVRQTQGSTLPEDVSRFETGPAYARLFTQFVGYFNMMANTNATALKQITGEMGLRKGAGKALYVVTMGLLMPIWVAEAIAQAFRGGPEDEDDDGYLDDWMASVFGFGTIKGIFAQVPIVGQVSQGVVSRFNDNPADDKFSLSPAVSLIESAAGSPASVYKAIVEDGPKQKAVRDVAALVTMATGIPVYAAARPIGYAAGVADDRIEPTGPVDLTRGLVTGTASPESKQR